jgi:hypothetical protein
MNGLRSSATAPIAVAAILLLAAAGCMLQAGEQRKPRTTLFVGIDASQSFKHSGYYENAITFLAHYIYGHLNGLGGLEKTTSMFVGSVGGKRPGDPKSFHPIHDFQGKNIEQIAAYLRTWFPPADSLTDFNSFFHEVARITKERNLVLAPITLLVVTDGIPDVALPDSMAGSHEHAAEQLERTNVVSPGVKARAQRLYEQIDLDPLEYLSRNITLRVIYLSPTVAQQWRTHIPRQRIRFWAVDAEVMKGWKNQIRAGASIEEQERLWKWVREIVDFRVRSIKV